MTFAPRSGNESFYANLAAKSQIEQAVAPSITIAANQFIFTPTPTLTYDQTKAANQAVAYANAILATWPTAKAGVGGGNTVGQITEQVLKGIGDFATAIADLNTVETEGFAVLHWWGWTLKLTENATQAFSRLLGDAGLLATALGGLALSPPLAAAVLIFDGVDVALKASISTNDTNNTGVTLTGYAWVLVTVAANPAVPEAANPASA